MAGELTERLRNPNFTAEEFLDNTVWKAIDDADGSFDPLRIHGAICSSIQQLTEHEVRLDDQVQQLEQDCVEEVVQQRKKVNALMTHNKTAYSNFQELDERVNTVATKVVYLRDQLESVNIPKSRNYSALRMMSKIQNYSTIDSEDVVLQDLMIDPLAEEAEGDDEAGLIHKLDTISNELPSNQPRFANARGHIAKAYDSIENKLIKGFLKAYEDYEACTFGFENESPDRLEARRQPHIEVMKRVSEKLQNFRHYNEAISEFIDASQQIGIAETKEHIFIDILNKCRETDQLVNKVFVNAESVMVRYISSLFQGKLKTLVHKLLGDKAQPVEQYLRDMAYLYAQTVHLAAGLRRHLKLGKDTTFIDQLIMKTIFRNHLEFYADTEFQFLKEKSASLLTRYYESRNHVKRQLQAGGLSDFKREVQNKIHINIGLNVDDHDGEVFLSQETAISMLQLFKGAFGRAKEVIDSTSRPQHCAEIYALMEQFVCAEFVNYAIELALYHCPLPDSKTPPKLHFLAAVSDASSIMYLFEKQVLDNLWLENLYGTDPIKECFTAKSRWSDQFEQKLDLGLERLMTAICSYARHILTTEQRRTDFKPESSDINMMHSAACVKVVSYLNSVINEFKSKLDGANLVGMLTELGVRVHKVIYEHLLGFQYNSMGAMLCICDVNEYRTCMKQLKDDLVDNLFSVLHGLCNLLVVPPDNLSQVCSGEPLGLLDKNIVNAFVQLRADFKSERLLDRFFAR